MNILFLSSIFPSSRNPACGTFNFEMCKALQRAGADLRMIAPQAWPEATRARMKGESIGPTKEIQQQDWPTAYPTYWYPPKFMQSRYGQFFWKSIQPALDDLLADWTPDFVLSYWAHPDGYAGQQLAERLNIPCACIVGGSDVLVVTKTAARREAVADVLKKSEAVLTVSNQLAGNVEDLGVPSEQVFPLYQGVDLNRFYPEAKATAKQWLGLSPERPLLIWVGRMVSIKNLELLLDVAEMKANQGDHFGLCLLGDGPLRPRIEQLIKQKRLESIVSLIGSVGHDELPGWYQAADITCLCSHSEGLPNVLRESLACGTPFVSTDVGSIAEIANENYSLLTPPNDRESFLAAINTVLAGDYQQAAEQAPVRSWDDMADEVLELAESLCGQNAPQGLPSTK